MIVVTPFQKYSEIINRNPATKKSYRSLWKIFENYSGKTPDEFVKLPKLEIDDLIFNYIVHLNIITDKTGKYQNSYPNLMAPIRLLLDQADILLNWRNIKRQYPERRALSNQLPYTTKHVQKMLTLVNCPRDIAFVHLMASSAIRVGGIFDITCADVKYIGSGAIITVYRGSTSEYRCCITPEATTVLKNYLATRDNTSAIDPLFTVRNNSRKLSDGSIKDIMKRIKRKIPELNINKGRKSKDGYSANHAFRKRIEIIFSKTGVPESFNKYMTNHEITVRIRNYFAGVSDEDLWEQFQKAIPELTIDDTERLKIKHELDKKELTQKIPEKFKEKLESIEGQLVELREERAGKVIEFYDDLAERKGADEIEEIKTKLDDTQIEEITEARVILNVKPLEITPSQDMLRKKYLISKQESIISSLKEELRKAEIKIPKPNPKWFKDFESMTHKEILKIYGKSEDNEFSVWADSLEVCEDLKEHIEFAEQYLTELKKRK